MVRLLTYRKPALLLLFKLAYFLRRYVLFKQKLNLFVSMRIQSLYFCCVYMLWNLYSFRCECVIFFLSSLCLTQFFFRISICLFRLLYLSSFVLVDVFWCFFFLNLCVMLLAVSHLLFFLPHRRISFLMLLAALYQISFILNKTYFGVLQFMRFFCCCCRCHLNFKVFSVCWEICLMFISQMKKCYATANLVKLTDKTLKWLPEQ